MFAKAPNVKPGSLRANLRSLTTFYDRPWLIRYLVQRQVTRKYRRSHLGLAWALLGPLMMIALLTLIFSEVVGIKHREVFGTESTLNFGLFLYCGLLPFMAYAEALNRGVTTIRRNSDLVQKVVFPLEILPLTQALTTLVVRNVFGVAALLILLLVLGQPLHWTLVLLPLVIVLQLIFNLGLNYLTAVVGTYVPDVKETLRAVVRGTFFITPILWPSGRVPENLSFLVDYNPLAFLVGAYRSVVLNGEPPSLTAAAYFFLFAVALLVVGFVLFNRVKHDFADLL